MCVCVCVYSVVQDSAIPWSAARQAALSTAFPRQEYWSGLPFPSPKLINQSIKISSFFKIQIFVSSRCCCSVTKSCPTLSDPSRGNFSNTAVFQSLHSLLGYCGVTSPPSQVLPPGPYTNISPLGGAGGGSGAIRGPVGSLEGTLPSPCTSSNFTVY